jgi:hypothetical protein
MRVNEINYPGADQYKREAQRPIALGSESKCMHGAYETLD